MSITPTLVEFPTPALSGQPPILKGYLWKPEGDGPFPAIVYNHGSGTNQDDMAALGVWFVRQGYVFFFPHRRGHGQSPGPQLAQEGINDLIQQVPDVIAALDYLKTVPHVDTHKVALAGGSYGGIMTMLTAEQDLRQLGHLGIRAAVNFASAAESWGSNPPTPAHLAFRQPLVEAAKKAKVPIFFLQASNDYTTAPSQALAQVMSEAGLPHQMRIFPVHYRSTNPRVPGSAEDHVQGHGKFFQSPDEWGTSVLAFLEPNLDITVSVLPVAPATTDSEITDHLDDHYVLRDSAVLALGKLLVFLPGQGAVPASFRSLLTEAAHAGYHVVALSYSNTEKVSEVCVVQNADCPGQVHLATIQGGHVPAVSVSVTPASSICNRLAKLLKYLDQIQPDADWDDFLEGLDPVWSRITLCGHSRGGGTVSYMAKNLFAVERVVLLSSPSGGLGTAPAAWVSAPGAKTAPARYFGLFHATEAESAQELAMLQLLVGTTDAAVSVDGAEWPFGKSHILTTQVSEPTPQTKHLSTGADGVTPVLSDGTPVFRKAWRYLLGL